MKTFIALTFIGILTYGYAQLVTKTKCKDVTPMDGFSAPEFFTGKWYVTHVQKVTSKTVCQTFDTSAVSSQDLFVSEFTYNKDGQEIPIRCEANSEPVERKLHFSCKSNGNEVFKTEFVVLSTDFKDYAVFYRCVTFTSGSNAGSKADNYLVVSKKSGNEEIPDKAKPFTKDLNLQKCSDLRTLKQIV
uniref:Putative salivary lipocalin 4 n=1 Tax=Panstrongylus lignarius TaxID=156445 RepID=A0A224XLG6_9HEMI